MAARPRARAPPMWLSTQGADEASSEPDAGHASRQSLDLYARLAITEAQAEYDRVISTFPLR